MEVPVGTKLKPIIEFHGIREHHLAFAADDMLELTDNSRTDGWWTARNLTNGNAGLIPSNFVEAQLSPKTRARMEKKARDKAKGFMVTVKNKSLTEQARAKGIQELRLMSYSMGSLCQDMYDFGLMESFVFLLREGTAEKTWEEAGLILGRTTYLVKDALREIAAGSEWLFPLIRDRLTNLCPATRDSNFGIMSIMNSICIDPSLHDFVIKNDIVPLMLKHLENDPGVRAEMPQESAKCLKNLCYQEKNREYLVSVGVVEVLQHFAPRTDISNETREMVKGALVMMGGFKGSGKAGAATGKKGSYLMMSYQWDNQQVVLKIKERLEKEGYSVWLDLDEMKEDIVDKMASAVEGAEMICMGYSRKYRDSENCKLEGHYAKQLQKPLVPILLESGAQNLGGWLGIILGTKVYYDFSADSKFEASVQGLIKELGNRCKGEIKQSTNSGPVQKSKLVQLEERIQVLEKENSQYRSDMANLTKMFQSLKKEVDEIK